MAYFALGTSTHTDLLARARGGGRGGTAEYHYSATCSKRWLVEMRLYLVLFYGSGAAFCILHSAFSAGALGPPIVSLNMDLTDPSSSSSS